MVGDMEWHEDKGERTPFSFSMARPMSDRMVKRHVECRTHGRQPVGCGPEDCPHPECLVCLVEWSEAKAQEYRDLLAVGGEDFRDPKRLDEMSPDEVKQYERHQAYVGIWSKKLSDDVLRFSGLTFGEWGTPRQPPQST